MFKFSKNKKTAENVSEDKPYVTESEKLHDVATNTETVESEKKTEAKKLKGSQKIEPEKPKGGQKIEPEKPQLLILIVESVKAEFYADLLQSFNVNVCLTSYAKGTSSAFLGVEGTEKAVLFAPISEKRSKMIMDKLEEKFNTIKNGKGVAVTVPFSGIIGLNSYSFFIDNRDVQIAANNNKNLQTEGN